MSYDSSIMDDNDTPLQGIHTGLGDNKNEDINPKGSWNGPPTDFNGSSGLASPTPNDVYEVKADATEIELEDRGTDQEDGGNQASDKSFDFEENEIRVPVPMENSSKSFVPTMDDADELVVDISPNGHSLTSLETYAKQSSRASRVKGMYVFDNIFTVLPKSVSRFNNLRSLKIFSNEVRLLPEEVGNIDLLEHLQMKVCPVGLGKLPPLGRLNFLKTLELHQTPLRPSIFSLPSEISKLQLLTRLAVCNFSISFLPPEIGDLKNLEELDLSFNKLRTLPSEISSLIALKHFRAESNKLIELPSGFARLPNLRSIDVAHNKLTSLEILGLSVMTSLRALNAKFNKLQNTGQIPEWVTCNLEGNPFLLGEVTSSSDGSDAIVDSDLLPPSTADGDEVSSPALVSVFSKESCVSKNARHAKHKRGWKRQGGVQQLQARQDRLNLSRKAKVEVCKDSVDTVSMRGGQTDMEEQTSSRFLGIDLPEDLLTNETDFNGAEEGVTQITDCREDDNASEACFHNCSYTQKNHELPLTSLPKSVDSNSAPGRTTISSHCSRKVISGDRSNQNAAKQSADDERVVDGEDGQTFTFTFKSEPETGLVHGRRRGGSLDRNPKPTKRRKSAQAFSEASYMYRSKSLVGSDTRLQDGFYDAGREHPFIALEVLESQQVCFESREVILVDRDKDEELDVIAFSAQNFLAKLELAGGYLSQTESCGLSTSQKAMILSLFVSDCFGGSDKTLSVTNARRAALGGCLGVPFLCSCSSSSVPSINELNSLSSEGTVPTVHQLCETSARLLKAQRQSNVVPLGLLPYGVCRHRAILFKYLCDRSSIPCELVRGYLDYVPHAWNVVLVRKENAVVRMLVDSCRPLDIREEKDPEYFCRYIPFRRLQLPTEMSKNLEVVSEEIFPVLLDEIGRGASGSVVHKCTLGSVTAAAKVHVVDQANETVLNDMVSRFLSELRIFCSLKEHPHIVSFYGHEFSSGSVMPPDDGKQGSTAIQLTIFMEYVPGISLEMVLSRYAEEGRTHMPIKEAAYISKAVVHALSFVHSKGIVHRDIKSSNVLVDLNGEWDTSTPPVKLCDFDSAVPISSSSAHTCYLAHRGIPPAEVCVGTPRWMAPEVFQAMYNQRPYGLEADMWSFGCLIFEMLTLQVPYAGLPEAQIHSYIQTGRRPPLPAELEGLISESASVEDQASGWDSMSDKELEIMKALVNLFKSCTESSTHSRPTTLEALESLSVLLDSNLTDDSDIRIGDSDKLLKLMDDPCQEAGDDGGSSDGHGKFDGSQSLREKTDDASLIQEKR
eukprot:c10242_g1_i2 orf=202-4080(-)